MINIPSVINLDFADVQTVMTNKGIAHIGIGMGKGEDKAEEAIKMAVESPLLETTIEGASDVIINVSGDISLIDANIAASYVQELTGDNVNIIFGAMYNADDVDTCKITVIATGIAAQPNSTGIKYVPGSTGFQGGFNPVNRPVTGTNMGTMNMGSMNFSQGVTRPYSPMGMNTTTQSAVAPTPVAPRPAPAPVRKEVQPVKPAVEEKPIVIPEFLKFKNNK